MAKIEIFNESIIIDSLQNPELNKEILKVLEESKKGQGVFKSNFGGFQTNTIENQLIAETILKQSIKCITDNYQSKIKKIKFELLNMWINENLKNSFNIPHVHPGSHFSGVYYIETTKKNGELIFFKDGGSSLINLGDFLNYDDSNFYKIKPQKDMFILFPSSLKHMVTPHSENGKRISISFNIKLSNG